MAAQLTPSPAASNDNAAAVVTALHRFAVKGLERDALDQVALETGGSFPYDRRWALHFAGGAGAKGFSPATPEWLHKSAFLCAFTATELMASFESRFDDATRMLTVSRRSGGGAPPLSARLDEVEGRAQVDAFFSNASGRAVHVVSSGASPTKAHQFGNTNSGVSAGDGSTRTIHIVNANTVRALAAAAGVPLHPERFRANVILDGALPAWSEFGWVGHQIQLGSATLRVIKRTVRCEGVNADARHGSGAADVDVPGLLAKHFPEHGPYLGVYAQVVGAGTVRVGDHAVAR